MVSSTVDRAVPADTGERHCTTCGTAAAVGARFCAMCGSTLAVSAGAVSRRNVVVLFCDLVGFTAISEGLDPEALRAIMDRYFRMCSRVIWNQGGTTEKFIGDAVMAVFGLPVSAEDDALRAIRAALDVLDGLAALNSGLQDEFGIELRVRIGVHAGPVSASYDTSGDFRVVGDTVNTASRLQSAARAGEVLLGEQVADLVRSRVHVAAVAPLAVKGKGKPLAAWRVVSAEPPPDRLRAMAPMVDRRDELARLCAVFDEGVRTGRGRMVTVVGPPGVGKTRLVAAFTDAVSAAEPTVLLGQNRSVIAGQTYRAVADLLSSAKAAWTSFERVGAVDPIAGRAAACLHDLSRPAGGHSAVEIEEVAWALRTFLAAAAETKPVVVVWEDMHRAESSLCELVRGLARDLAGLPVLQLCTARPETTGAERNWSRDDSGHVLIDLDALSEPDTRGLVAALLDAAEVVGQDCDTRIERIIEACEGNPLFAELLVDVLEENADDPLPATIQAVLAARLDRLAPSARRVLEIAAAVGRDFPVADVRRLASSGSEAGLDVDTALRDLTRLRFLAGHLSADRLQFAPMMLRDVAYELTAKQDRLAWHLALADTGVADGEAAAAHLETAWRLSRELYPAGRMTTELAIRASTALGELATAATDRKDMSAAIELLERAVSASPPAASAGLRWQLRLSDAWLARGDRDQALAVVDAVDVPELSDAHRVGLAIQRTWLGLRCGTLRLAGILAAEQDLSERLAALPDEHLLWSRFHQLRAHRYLMQERVGQAEAAFGLAEKHALACGDTVELHRVLRAVGELALWGPTPVAEALKRCRVLREELAGSRVSLVPVLATTAGLLALDGQADRARTILTAVACHVEELKLHSAEVGLHHMRGFVAAAGGDHEAAHGHFTSARDLLSAVGQADGADLLDCYAAASLAALGQDVPERYHLASEDEVRALTDARTAAYTASLCAYAAARDGTAERARSLAEHATAEAAQMDDPYFQASVQELVAAVYGLIGAADEARRSTERAVELYAAKGAVAADRLRRGLPARGEGTSQ